MEYDIEENLWTAFGRMAPGQGRRAWTSEPLKPILERNTYMCLEVIAVDAAGDSQLRRTSQRDDLKTEFITGLAANSDAVVLVDFRVS